MKWAKTEKKYMNDAEEGDGGGEGKGVRENGHRILKRKRRNICAS